MDKNGTLQNKKGLDHHSKIQRKRRKSTVLTRNFLVVIRYVHKSNSPQASYLNMKLNMNCS